MAIPCLFALWVMGYISYKMIFSTGHQYRRTINYNKYRKLADKRDEWTAKNGYSEDNPYIKEIALLDN